MAASWGSSASTPSALCCEGFLPLPASIPDHCCRQLPSGYLYPTRYQCGCGADHAQGKAHGLGDIEAHHHSKGSLDVAKGAVGPVPAPLGLCALCLEMGCVAPVGLGIPESLKRSRT